MQSNYRDDQRFVSLLARCRRLRRDSTDTENLLWHLLRGRQVAGAKFRRQHQFGPFILDLYCPEQGLVIEADGGQHSLPEAVARDAARAHYLAERGIRVLRFTDVQVLTKTEAVMEVIWQALAGPSP